MRDGNSKVNGQGFGALGTSEEAKKSYKKCLKFRWKKPKIKVVPYDDIDMVLYLAERYISLMEEMGV